MFCTFETVHVFEVQLSKHAKTRCRAQFPMKRAATNSVFNSDKIAFENDFRFHVFRFLKSCFASSTQRTFGTTPTISPTTL